jgi:hypothetical protein
MTNKEIMERCTKRAFGYKAKAVFDKIEDIIFKEKIENDGSYFLVVNKSSEAMESFTSDGLLRMTASQILLKDMEIYTKEYKIVWMVKKPKPTYLDKVEENYLRNIIAPLAKSGCSNFTVEKYNCKDCYGNRKYYIQIFMDNPNYSRVFSETIRFPMFDVSQNMYRGLDTKKKYSLDYLVE